MFFSSNKNNYKGYLYKWTNYMRGYQKRWFVLSNGCLSYYRNPSEVNHTCRGSINLATSTIKIQDPCTIVISNAANQTFHLKSLFESETHQWATALHFAKDTAITLLKEDDSNCDIPIGTSSNVQPLNCIQQTDGLSLKSDIFSDDIIPNSSQIQKEFQQRMYDLNTSMNLIRKNSDQLLNALKDFNKINFAPNTANYSINSEISSNFELITPECLSPSFESSDSLNHDPRSPPHSLNTQIIDFIQCVNEKNKTFQVSVQACANSCSEFINQIPIVNSQYQKIIRNEREQRLRLENMVEELAKQLGALEKKAAKKFESESLVSINPPSIGHSKEYNEVEKLKVSGSTKSESDDECFFDALEDIHSFQVSLPRLVSESSVDLLLHHTVNEYESCSSDSEYEQNNPKSGKMARVIVRKIDKKTKTSKNGDNMAKEVYKPKIAHSHRRTASSGQPSNYFNSSLMVNQSMRENAKVKSSLEVPNIMSTSQDGGELLNKHMLSENSISDIKLARSVPSLIPKSERKEPRVRRKVIPVRPNLSISLWGIMKNCIGKELSKIPVPVNFNEPLSMIQRLTEDFEYSECLDAAAACNDPVEQMAMVAAFTVSSYSTTTNRTGKPFNPLLGETFECDRIDDMGWRSVAEQVSHHPPSAALHCESERGWTCSQEFTMSSKFRGKYLAIIPLGIARLKFKGSNNYYTWRKVTSTVHNIIVGKLWIDNHGEMDIYNHTTGHTCHLTYKPYSYFSKEPSRRVTGVITEKNGDTKYVLNGTWDDKFEGSKVLEIRKDKHDQPVFETGPAEILWQMRYPPEYTAEMYNFTEFALTLNEPEEGVAPTDTRLRPDQRLMENGLWDEANRLKEELEEKQRAKRRVIEKENEHRKIKGLPLIEHTPSWFSQQHDSVTAAMSYVFNDRYWITKDSGKWGTDLPDIF